MSQLADHQRAPQHCRVGRLIPHYPVSADLFALHIHLIPLQLPPPRFRLMRPLKPFLAHFLQRRGQG